MFSSKKSRCFIISIVCIYYAIFNTAYANGINPPRPAPSVEVKATCEEFTGEIYHEIHKAHIVKADLYTDKITFFEEGGSENVLSIASIFSVEFKTGEVDEKGFAAGSIDDKYKKRNVKVYLGKDSSVMLTGFKEMENSRFKINLNKCKKVIFSVSGNSSLPQKDVPKK